MLKTIKCLAAVALSALVATACTQDTGDWIDKDQVTAEYFDEAKKLDLAPGWSWPADPGYLSKGSDGAAIRYSVNAGRVDAAWYWHCSWARTYLDLPPGAERDRVFEQVLKLRDSAYYQFGLRPEERAARDRAFAAAKLGDFRTLALIIDGKCRVNSM